MHVNIFKLRNDNYEIKKFSVLSKSCKRNADIEQQTGIDFFSGMDDRLV